MTGVGDEDQVSRRPVPPVRPPPRGSRGRAAPGAWPRRGSRARPGCCRPAGRSGSGAGRARARRTPCGRFDRSTPSSPSPGGGGPARSVTPSACALLVVGVAADPSPLESSRKLGDSRCARSMIAHPSAPSVTTETGKIPRSSRSTWTARSSSRRDTCASKSGESSVEPGDHRREVAMLALERVDLVDELACDAQGTEDPVLLALDVPFEVGDEAGQARHRSGGLPCAQVLSDVVCLVDEGGVLVHQLADRRDLPASAVLAHLSPPGPSHDAAGDCRAGCRRGSGRRCRGASGSPPAR